MFRWPRIAMLWTTCHPPTLSCTKWYQSLCSQSKNCCSFATFFDHQNAFSSTTLSTWSSPWSSLVRTNRQTDSAEVKQPTAATIPPSRPCRQPTDRCWPTHCRPRLLLPAAYRCYRHWRRAVGSSAPPWIEKVMRQRVSGGSAKCYNHKLHGTNNGIRNVHQTLINKQLPRHPSMRIKTNLQVQEVW